MKYFDRDDAGRKLLPYLEKFRGMDAVVLAIPRGGVPVGYHVAKYLDIPLELLMCKKIGHPTNKEYAVGAVTTEDVLLDDKTPVPHDYLENEITRLQNDLARRYQLLKGDHKAVDLQGKTLIVIDDGVATGNTILSSIAMLRRKNPKQVIVAVPVASQESAELIEQQADEFICPLIPEELLAIGQFYIDFEQVSDEEVKGLINKLNEECKLN